MSSPSSILKQKYPAKEHIKRLISHLQSKATCFPSGSLLDNSLIYLEGTKSAAYPDSDLEVPFRQSRNFFYVTGCNEPDCAYVYNVRTGRSTLYIPAPPDQRTMVYNGPAMTVCEAREKYDVDEVEAVKAGLDVLKMLSQRLTAVEVVGSKYNFSVLTLDDMTIQGIKQPTASPLKAAFESVRITKTEWEISALREANRISGLAHLAVMKQARHAKNERQLKASFISTCISHGGDEQAYGPIVAAGTRGSTLHYMANNQAIDPHGNILVDASCEYACYASDITRTFPASGRFDKESRQIYEIVLEMQKTCIGMLKEGVFWDDCNDRAHEILVSGLLKLGILKGDEEEIRGQRVSYLFLMHGLGHYIGLETHDVSGPTRRVSTPVTGPKQLSEATPDISNLNLADDTKPQGLPANSVVTVEPGIYFNRLLLEPALQQEKWCKFINADVLERYWKVGGVRIEDCLRITKHGSENLTASVPKEIEEIERIVSGGAEVVDEEDGADDWEIVDVGQPGGWVMRSGTSEWTPV